MCTVGGLGSSRRASALLGFGPELTQGNEIQVMFKVKYMQGIIFQRSGENDA